jgi:hypothetical protein
MAMIQATTAVIAVATIGALVALVLRGRMNWRYAAPPGVILAELVVFYAVVLLFGGFATNDAAAFASATIRLQAVALFATVVFMAYRGAR